MHWNSMAQQYFKHIIAKLAEKSTEKSHLLFFGYKTKEIKFKFKFKKTSKLTLNYTTKTN